MKLLSAWPRQPFLGLAFSAMVGIVVADYRPSCSVTAGLVLAAVAAGAWLLRSSLSVYVFVGCGFFLLHSLRTTDTPGLTVAHALGEGAQPVTVTGTVITEPRLSARGTASFLLQARSIEIDGETQNSPAKFLVRWRHEVEFGDNVRLFGAVQPIEGPRNPGEFDMRAYLARKDIYRALIVRYAENGAIVEHGGGPLLLRAARKSRNWMETTLRRGLDDSADVTSAINGMVLGLRHQTAEDIEEPFQQTGTLHLFAVAGLHVGIVASLLWILATILRLPRKWATALIIPALLFYSAITGLHTSSVRAAVMSAVLLGGFIAERKAFAFNSLAAAAVLIVAWDTNELFAVGFQLSFCVVAAILLFQGPAYGFLCRKLEPDPFLPRSLFSSRQRAFHSALTWLARAASVSFAAWMGSLPLMVWYYHLVTLISLLANLVVVPMAFFVLAGALLSLVTAPFSSGLSVIFNNANWALTKLILGAVSLFASVPGGHFYVEHPHRPNDALLEINALDLRSGGAVHLRAGRHDYLIDAGPAREYERVLLPYLRTLGVNRLDALVLTESNASHLGSAGKILLDFRTRQIVESARPDQSALHRKFMELLTTLRKPEQRCQPGDELRLSSDVAARVLFPPLVFEGNRAADQALVLQLVISGTTRVLLMSDSGTTTERVLLRNYPDLRADILIKGQHHTGDSGSPEFLDRVQPRLIVATSRDFPESERLKPEWVSDISRRGIRLFRQDETGAVRIRVYRDGWEATPWITGETFRAVSR